MSESDEEAYCEAPPPERVGYGDPGGDTIEDAWAKLLAQRAGRLPVLPPSGWSAS